jgi:hypothetical protein
MGGYSEILIYDLQYLAIFTIVTGRALQSDTRVNSRSRVVLACENVTLECVNGGSLPRPIKSHPQKLLVFKNPRHTFATSLECSP